MTTLEYAFAIIGWTALLVAAINVAFDYLFDYLNTRGV